MNPRRVLYVLRSVGGGVPAVVHYISRGLDDNRYEPIILFDTHDQSEIRKKLSKSDIKTIDLKKCLDGHTSNLRKPRKGLLISRRIESHFGKELQRIYLSLKTFTNFLSQQTPWIRSYMKVFHKYRIDLVHTHSNLYHGKPEIIAAWMTNIPCVSHNHGYYKFNHFDRMLARFVDAFIYISRDVAEYHTSQGKGRFKGTIIHNGIDMSKFTQPFNTVSVRKEFGIASDQTLVGIIGRIDYWKGHDFFIEAIAEASEKITGLKGMIVGEFEKSASQFNLNYSYFRRLQYLIKTLHLEDKIIFTGIRHDVPWLISDLDIVVHASSMPEPFGLVVIEAMAAGKPVIATAAGGVLDIIEDGVNGILVPCRDSKAMARAILQIISNPEKANQMGVAARQRVAEKFTVQQQVKALEELYDDILAKPKRRYRFLG